MEAMRGHAMVPLESLSLELPNGDIVVDYDRDTVALQEEITALRSRQQHLDRRRRESLDKLIDLKGSIRVFSRVRPLIPTSNLKTKSPVTVEQEKIAVQSVGIKKEFIVDRVFKQESTQEDVFLEVMKPILRSALDGHNVCILAYGQTGTGKTYTMEGTDGKPGIVPRAIQELFSHASEDNSSTYTFSISMLEVYLGSLRDLLAPRQPLFRHTECSTIRSDDSSYEFQCDKEEPEPPCATMREWFERVAAKHAARAALATESGTEPTSGVIDQAAAEAQTEQETCDGSSTEDIIRNGKKWICEEVMLCFEKYIARKSRLVGLEYKFDEHCNQCFNVESYNNVFHHYNFRVMMKMPGSAEWTTELYFAEVKRIFGTKFYFCCDLEPEEDGDCYACKSQGVVDLRHPATGGFMGGAPDAQQDDFWYF